MDNSSPSTWNLAAECGGDERLTAILQELYDRIFDDVIIGFLFAKSDKAELVRSQQEYVMANLGDRSGKYTGTSIRKAHVALPILPGQFDRRHQILSDVLHEFDAPPHVIKAWLDFDQSLRELVVNTGATARDQIMAETES